MISRDAATLQFARRDATAERTAERWGSGPSWTIGHGADWAVAYDERLAARIRELLEEEPDVTEQRMFGGLAFLLGGHMALAASGQGGALVRVGPDDAERLVASTSAQPMEMRGRPMRGWLRIDADDLGTKRQLAPWVRRSVEHARSLPAKRPKRRRAPT